MPFCLFVFPSFFLSFLDAMYICRNKAGSFFEAVYFFLSFLGERGGSVVECRTPEREVRGSRPTSAVLCP